MTKKIYFTISSIILVLVFQLAIFSQSSPKDWVRIQTDDGEFSIELPDNGRYFYDKDGFYLNQPWGGAYNFNEMQMLNASIDGTYMSVEIYKVANAKGYLDSWTDRSGFAVSKIDAPSKDFMVRKAEYDRSYERVKKRAENINFEIRYIASKSHFYAVTVWSRGTRAPATEKLLSSIRLGAENTQNGKIIKLSEMKPLTLEQIGDQLSKKEIDALPDPPKFDKDAPGQLSILYVPWSGFNFAGQNERAKGVVKFKVTYSKEGRVDKISLISGLPGGLNHLAFFSILRTKFLPAEENGKPVTTERQVNYDYTTMF